MDGAKTVEPARSDSLPRSRRSTGTGAEPGAGVRPAATLALAGLPFLLGLGLAWFQGLAERGGARAAPGPTVLWAGDRDGGELVGLDRDLLVSARIPLPYPVELEVRTAGDLWVVQAPAGHPAAPHRLLRLEADGTRRVDVGLGVFLDLALLDGSDALVVESAAAAPRPVTRYRADGTGQLLGLVAGARCVAGRADRVLVGTDVGRVLLLDGAGTPLERSDPGGFLVDVAPGPRVGTWWVLDGFGGGGGASRLLLLDERLNVVWQVPCGLRALHLTPVPGAERVWLADTGRPWVRRFGAQGATELVQTSMAMTGLDRGLALPDGGAVFVVPGALLRLDASGAAAPGQGGFRFLVDVGG